jgi:hypothetical protein
MVLDLHDYRSTLRKLIELQVFYAKKEAEIEKLPLADSLNQYTEMYYYSTLYSPDVPASSNEEWGKVVEKISQMPAQAWAVLEKYFVPRMEKDLEDARCQIAQSYNGFMYEYFPEYETGNKEEFLTLHFRNFYAPDSPFNHTCELVEGLQTIVAKALEERPDVKQVQCASWLNNLPHFLQLFPQQWQDRANFCYPMSASTGWWGRFINREGKINQKAVDKFKSTLEFDCPNRHCRCTITELEQHLDSFEPCL